MYKNILAKGKVTFYHGTSEEHANIIVNEGIDFNKIGITDVGDFGFGFYLTNLLSRAKSYGNTILEVVISDINLAFISNPYFCRDFKTIEPISKEEKMFFNLAFDEKRNMKTCHQSSKNKLEVSKEINKKFTDKGYTGITTDYNGAETVVFDLTIISSIKILKD